MRYTTHTVLHNLTEGIILVFVILFLFLGNFRGSSIVALTIPFSLLFASICLSLKNIPANLLSLGALDFGMVVDGAVVMVENIVRHLTHRETNNKTSWNAFAMRLSKYSVRFSTPSPSSSPPTCRYSRSSASKAACSAHGLDRCVCASRRARFLHAYRASARRRVLPKWCHMNGTTRHDLPAHLALPYRCALGHRASSCHIRRGQARVVPCRLPPVSGIIGSEFLPHLDEGAIWARGTLAPSTGPAEGSAHHESGPRHFASFPGSHPGRSPGRPSRRRHRHHRLLQHRIFRGPETQKKWRPVFHQDKEN